MSQPESPIEPVADIRTTRITLALLVAVWAALAVWTWRHGATLLDVAVREVVPGRVTENDDPDAARVVAGGTLPEAVVPDAAAAVPEVDGASVRDADAEREGERGGVTDAGGEDGIAASAADASEVDPSRAEPGASDTDEVTGTADANVPADASGAGEASGEVADGTVEPTEPTEAAEAVEAVEAVDVAGAIGAADTDEAIEPDEPTGPDEATGPEEADAELDAREPDGGTEPVSPDADAVAGADEGAGDVESLFELRRREEIGTLSRLLETLRFEPLDDTPSAASREPLERAFEILFLYPDTRLALVVESRESNDVAFDRRLARERGETVVDYLVSRGIERARLSTAAGDGGGLPFGEHRVRVTVEDQGR